MCESHLVAFEKQAAGGTWSRLLFAFATQLPSSLSAAPVYYGLHLFQGESRQQ